MPLTTGRDASSSRIAPAIAFIQFHARSGVSALTRQLHSLPRSHAAIAAWPFSSRTKCRTKRTCQTRGSPSQRRALPCRASGTKERPLIQPVTRPTTSFMSFVAATSQRKRKRRIISSSTPAGFGSGPSRKATALGALP